MKGQLRIDTVHAFIVLDHDGTEGIPAINVDGTMMPLVAADAARVESLRPIAQLMADAQGVTIRLVRFSVREEVEELRPGGGGSSRVVPGAN